MLDEIWPAVEIFGQKLLSKENRAVSPTINLRWVVHQKYEEGKRKNNIRGPTVGDDRIITNDRGIWLLSVGVLWNWAVKPSSISKCRIFFSYGPSFRRKKEPSLLGKGGLIYEICTSRRVGQRTRFIKISAKIQGRLVFWKHFFFLRQMIEEL